MGKNAIFRNLADLHNVYLKCTDICNDLIFMKKSAMKCKIRKIKSLNRDSVNNIIAVFSYISNTFFMKSSVSSIDSSVVST